MKQATQLDTAFLPDAKLAAAIGALALVWSWPAGPAEACEPVPTYMRAASEITPQGPLVLHIQCGDYRCPGEAPAVALIAPNGQRISGAAVDYFVNGPWAFTRWQPDIELTEGADYKVVSDATDVVIDPDATTRVVTSPPVFDRTAVTWQIQKATRDEGASHCCGPQNSCGGRLCFGAEGTRTIAHARARANAPSTYAARLRNKGTSGDEVPWEPYMDSKWSVFDAPTDALCVVLDVWDMARDEKQEIEHCFAESIEGLGQLAQTWNGLEECEEMPPVERPDQCFLDGVAELGPDGLAGDGCRTSEALLEAWCEATSSDIDACASTDVQPAGPIVDHDDTPRVHNGSGKCSAAPGMRGSPVGPVALLFVLLGLCRRLLGRRTARLAVTRA